MKFILAISTVAALLQAAPVTSTEKGSVLELAQNRPIRTISIETLSQYQENEESKALLDTNFFDDSLDGLFQPDALPAGEEGEDLLCRYEENLLRCFLPDSYDNNPQIDPVASSHEFLGESGDLLDESYWLQDHFPSKKDNVPIPMAFESSQDLKKPAIVYSESKQDTSAIADPFGSLFPDFDRRRPIIISPSAGVRFAMARLEKSEEYVLAAQKRGEVIQVQEKNGMAYFLTQEKKKLRKRERGRLGELEVLDQSGGAKIIIAHRFINEMK